MTARKPGIDIRPEGTTFTVFSRHATSVELCLFGDQGKHELCRLPMEEGRDHFWHLFVEGTHAGSRYGYRAKGTYDPERGFWFDPTKLLVDPYSVELDRPFHYDPRLSEYGFDTTDLVPKALVTDCQTLPHRAPLFHQGGLIYEINVRAFTMRHPDIPAGERGTVKALTHPSVIAHLKRIGVCAIELMPITAWIDERHLPLLGLSNSWGYNPVALMALDPRLCPGGVRELADTVAALHAHGIGTILDLVFNHTGESDNAGPTLSMRGLDSLSYYRHPHGHPGGLINDTGCGNTLACDHKVVRDLVLDSLRHFVLHAGVDGFRFDLAPILGRSHHGFSADATLLAALQDDPVLADRVLIAEPWDVGPGGYQLGRFPPVFLEWNDWARDTMRKFWRGDERKVGDLATVLSGSSNIFHSTSTRRTRTVNFIAAHDGFTLADLVAYEHKHNEANGEHNRDGHDDNHSWNNGVEGETHQASVLARRSDDVKALLTTLFVSRGTIMLTAGDEMGRTQKGNNNAYAQDNELTWIDWKDADVDLLDHVETLAVIRARYSVFSEIGFLNGNGDVHWLTPHGDVKSVADWESPGNGHLAMILRSQDRHSCEAVLLAVLFNRQHEPKMFHLPGGARRWHAVIGSGMTVAPRSVSIFRAVDDGSFFHEGSAHG
jgi:glycogen operon protein